MPLVALAQKWNAPEFRRTIRVGKQEPYQITLTKAPLEVTKAELAALKKARAPFVEVDPTRAARMTKAAEIAEAERQAEREALERDQAEPTKTEEPIAAAAGPAFDAEG